MHRRAALLDPVGVQPLSRARMENCGQEAELHHKFNPWVVCFYFEDKSLRKMDGFVKSSGPVSGGLTADDLLLLPNLKPLIQ